MSKIRILTEKQARLELSIEERIELFELLEGLGIQPVIKQATVQSVPENHHHHVRQ